MERLVNIDINGILIKANANETILQVAEKNNIFIPRLCYLKDVHEEGNCRLCSIKIEGQKEFETCM